MYCTPSHFCHYPMRGTKWTSYDSLSPFSFCFHTSCTLTLLAFAHVSQDFLWELSSQQSFVLCVRVCYWTLTPMHQGPGRVFVIIAGTLNTRGWVVSLPYCYALAGLFESSKRGVWLRLGVVSLTPVTKRWLSYKGQRVRNAQACYGQVTKGTKRSIVCFVQPPWSYTIEHHVLL